MQKAKQKLNQLKNKPTGRNNDLLAIIPKGKRKGCRSDLLRNRKLNFDDESTNIETVKVQLAPTVIELDSITINDKDQRNKSIKRASYLPAKPPEVINIEDEATFTSPTGQKNHKTPFQSDKCSPCDPDTISIPSFHKQDSAFSLGSEQNPTSKDIKEKVKSYNKESQSEKSTRDVSHYSEHHQNTKIRKRQHQYLQLLLRPRR